MNKQKVHLKAQPLRRVSVAVSSAVRPPRHHQQQEEEQPQLGPVIDSL